MLEKIFSWSRKKTDETEPGIRFGRYSDNNKIVEKVERWNEAENLFKEKKYYESLNKVYLRDSVLVYNLQGDSMRSPDLWWDQNTQRIYTDKKVWVKKGGTTLTGQNGMDARQDLSDINIKQVTGPIDLPDSLRPE